MKTVIIFLGVMLAGVVLPWQALAQSAGSTGTAGELPATAVVAAVSGSVSIRLQESDPWREAEPQELLPVGATISTGFDGRATVETGGVTLQVRPLTRLQIEVLLQREGEVRGEFSLPVGRIRGDIRTTDGAGSNIQIRSPIAIAGVRGTGFEFDGVNLQVDTGTVQLVNRFNEGVTVRAGEASTAAGVLPPPTAAQTGRQAVAVLVRTTRPEETTQEDRQGGSACTSAGLPASLEGVRLEWELSE